MPRFAIPKKIQALLLICVIAFAGSCAVRTIYVPPGQPVRLRETLRGVKVWVADSRGNWLESTLDLPEGWYALSDAK